ncbi:hypothetical protein CBFG_02106 [Clostridiales bacterium 1_7_47FAA]|nr:hypothetical protein CBFG_02106 [Clostridiales bacterium 1_7_47FAA]
MAGLSGHPSPTRAYGKAGVCPDIPWARYEAPYNPCPYRKTVSLNEDSRVPGSGLLAFVHVTFGSAAGEDMSYGRKAV